MFNEYEQIKREIDEWRTKCEREFERGRDADVDLRVKLQGALTMLEVLENVINDLAPLELAKATSHVQKHEVIPQIAALQERTRAMQGEQDKGGVFAPVVIIIDKVKELTGLAFIKTLVAVVVIYFVVMQDGCTKTYGLAEHAITKGVELMTETAKAGANAVSSDTRVSAEFVVVEGDGTRVTTDTATIEQTPEPAADLIP